MPRRRHLHLWSGHMGGWGMRHISLYEDEQSWKVEWSWWKDQWKSRDFGPDLPRALWWVAYLAHVAETRHHTRWRFLSEVTARDD